MSKRWSQEELKILTDTYIKLGIARCTVLLPNRTYKSINEKARKLRLCKRTDYWTLEEDNFLRSNYSSKGSILSSVSDLLNNTAKLNSGNTETFIIPEEEIKEEIIKLLCQ